MQAGTGTLSMKLQTCETRHVNCPNWSCSPTSNLLKLLRALPQNSSTLWGRRGLSICLSHWTGLPKRISPFFGSKTAPAYCKTFAKRFKLSRSTVFKASRMPSLTDCKFKTSSRDVISRFTFWRISVRKHCQSVPAPLGNELPSSWSQGSQFLCAVSVTFCNSSERKDCHCLHCAKEEPKTPKVGNVSTQPCPHSFQEDFVLIYVAYFPTKQPISWSWLCIPVFRDDLRICPSYWDTHMGLKNLVK